MHLLIDVSQEMNYTVTASSSWRPSELPSYVGPLDGPPDFEKDGSTPAPYEGHRWLPVRSRPGQHYDLSRTPASTLSYDAWGPSLNNWAAGAQIHYSFLQHLEEGDIWKYHFDHRDYEYERVSINFFAVRGKDIMDGYPFPHGDDESYLTLQRPAELKRHVIVDGAGTAAHFSFGPQYKAHDQRGMGWTDVLGRYKAYAEEHVCPGAPNMKKRAMKRSPLPKAAPKSDAHMEMMRQVMTS